METRDLRAELEYLSNQYRQTEMYKQSLAMWKAAEEGEDVATEYVSVPKEEYDLAYEYQECGLEKVIDLVEGIEGGELTKEDVQEVLRTDSRYKSVVRQLRDVLFFQRGLYEPDGRASENGKTPGVGEADAGGEEARPEHAGSV